MTRTIESIREWFLDEDQLTDGAAIGGYQFLEISNAKTSKFSVKVFFDGKFKFGLDKNQSRKIEVDKRNILVTVKPAVEIQTGQFATGDFILSASRRAEAACS